MWKLCRSLFEQCNRAIMIDSVVYMKMRALSSLTALKIKDIVVPSPFLYKHCLPWRELNNISHRNWNSKIQLYTQCWASCSCQSRPMIMTWNLYRPHWDVNIMQESEGCCKKDLEAILDGKVTMNWRKGLFMRSSARLSFNEMLDFEFSHLPVQVQENSFF